MKADLVNSQLLFGDFPFAAASTASLDDVATGPPLALQGRSNVLVTPMLSNASATCKVALALGVYEDGVFKVKAFVESATLTASATYKQATGGKFAAPGAVLPTGGFSHFKVIVTTISAGTGSILWSAY